MKNHLSENDLKKKAIEKINNIEKTDLNVI